MVRSEPTSLNIWPKVDVILTISTNYLCSNISLHFVRSYLTHSSLNLISQISKILQIKFPAIMCLTSLLNGTCDPAFACKRVASSLLLVENEPECAEASDRRSCENTCGVRKKEKNLCWHTHSFITKTNRKSNWTMLKTLRINEAYYWTNLLHMKDGKRDEKNPSLLVIAHELVS